MPQVFGQVAFSAALGAQECSGTWDAIVVCSELKVGNEVFPRALNSEQTFRELSDI